MTHNYDQVSSIEYDFTWKHDNINYVRMDITIKYKNGTEKKGYSGLTVFKNGDWYLNQLYPPVTHSGLGTWMLNKLLEETSKKYNYGDNPYDLVELQGHSGSHAYFHKLGFSYITQPSDSTGGHDIKMRIHINILRDNLAQILQQRQETSDEQYIYEEPEHFITIEDEYNRCSQYNDNNETCKQEKCWYDELNRQCKPTYSFVAKSK